jgi:chemotaxis protein CheC
MKRVEDLNAIELDTLREIGNIGCAHAATAISSLIKKKIDLTVPDIKIEKICELIKVLDNKNVDGKKVVAIYLELTKDFSGSILFVFSEKSALALSDILLSKANGTTKIITDLEQSALMEVGNIVVSAYANALGEFLNTRVMLTPPVFAHSFPADVMDKINKIVSSDTSHAVIFDTKLYEDTNLFDSYFILLPSPTALNSIITTLLS